MITNLLSAIPWIGEDFVQLVYNTDTICMSNAFPVIGIIHWGGSRRGLKARTPEQITAVFVYSLLFPSTTCRFHRCGWLHLYYLNKQRIH